MGKDKGKSDLGQAVKIGAARGFLKAVGLDPNTFEEPKQKKTEKEEDGGRTIETIKQLGRLREEQETETKQD